MEEVLAPTLKRLVHFQTTKREPLFRVCLTSAALVRQGLDFVQCVLPLSLIGFRHLGRRRLTRLVANVYEPSVLRDLAGVAK